MRAFLCPGCSTTLPVRSACPGHWDVRVSPDDLLRCTLCCPHCTSGRLVDDPGGTVILDFRRRHPWRGLDGSAWRTRRHT